jgi:hypothetical protein
VWASVRDSVSASVSASVWASVGASVYGQHEAGWLSFYDFFRDAVGLHEQTEKIDGLTALSQSAGWALPCTDLCFVSERHNELRRDERGRLHSLDQAAVEYPDGWRIYAVHGVRVPDWIIERPAEITVARIDAETNAEVRRVMVERYGAARFVKDSGAAVVDHDERWGTLYRREITDDEPLLMVEVINRSPEPDGEFRHYSLRVPPATKTALEAVAWTFDMRPAEYAQIAAES